MSDTLLNFTCRECRNSIIDFDRPEGACSKCGAVDTYEHCACQITTVLASEGDMIAYRLDSAHTVDERNDKWTDEYLEDQEAKAFEKIRSGKAKYDWNADKLDP